MFGWSEINLFLFSLLSILTGGILSLLPLSSKGRALFGAGGAIFGSLIGGGLALQALFTGAVYQVDYLWSIPQGSLAFQIDPLSAFFLILIYLISILGAFYGFGYKEIHHSPGSSGYYWFFYTLLVVSMAAVVTAANGILFLMAWEIMSLSSYFLVTFEQEREEVQRAGRVYLIATHIGTAFLFVMFWLLAFEAKGSMDFERWREISSISSSMAGLIFILALVGFGTKAGLMPLHIWLPEAHPAAPSPVSALMSGVMIKTGIYGILRILTFLAGLKAMPVWWGGLLIGLGIFSGLLGVLLALSQHDLKRLLAYHSVENMGIISIGLGLGLLGISLERPSIVMLGFLGGLFHILNHGVFKSLLFFSAGVVLQETHTRDMDEMGGLLKTMPVTGTAFLIGSMAICALPMMNGFLSELLIYLASFSIYQHNHLNWSGFSLVLPLSAILALALMGGLALACFVKAFSTIFLGEPRHGKGGRDPHFSMQISLLLLAFLCIALGPLFFFALAKGLLISSNTVLKPWNLSLPPSALEGVLSSLKKIYTLLGLGVLIFCGLALLRYFLLSRREVGKAVTWDCGYARPNARLQYTASSFAQPIVDLFSWILRSKKNLLAPSGLFPKKSHLSTETPDPLFERIYRPLLGAFRKVFGQFHWIQNGILQIYLLYIVITLILLLVLYLGLN